MLDRIACPVVFRRGCAVSHRADANALLAAQSQKKKAAVPRAFLRAITFRRAAGLTEAIRGRACAVRFAIRAGAAVQVARRAAAPQDLGALPVRLAAGKLAAARNADAIYQLAGAALLANLARFAVGCGAHPARPGLPRAATVDLAIGRERAVLEGRRGRERRDGRGRERRRRGSRACVESPRARRGRDRHIVRRS